MCPKVRVYEIDGPFFFGIADRFQDVLLFLEEQPKIFILRMRKVPAVDLSGVNALEIFVRRCKAKGIYVVMSGVRDRARMVFERMGTENLIGTENFCADITHALARAQELLDQA